MMRCMSTKGSEMRTEEKLRDLARNVTWVCQCVHNAYHQGADVSWKECSLGVCGSMEHILFQAGFDKELNPINTAW